MHGSVEICFCLSMGAIFLSSLMAFADVCLGICAELVSTMSVANDSALGASGTLRFPTPYSVEDFIRR